MSPIAVLDETGVPSEELCSDAGVLGEVALRARHGKSRYDARAFTERQASRNQGWHRTGDIGRLDAEGRLRIEGRLAHVIATADGPARTCVRSNRSLKRNWPARTSKLRLWESVRPVFR